MLRLILDMADIRSRFDRNNPTGYMSDMCFRYNWNMHEKGIICVMHLRKETLDTNILFHPNLTYSEKKLQRFLWQIKDICNCVVFSLTAQLWISFVWMILRHHVTIYKIGNKISHHPHCL